MAALAGTALGVAVAATPVLGQADASGPAAGDIGRGAQAGTARVGQGEDLQLDRIARYIGQDAGAVVHVHLSQVDLTNLQAFLQGTLQRTQIDNQQREAAGAQLRDFHTTAQNWLNQLKQAGAEELFITVSVQGQNVAPTVIVPVTDANADQVSQLLTPLAGQGQLSTARIGDVVVMSSQQQLQRFQAAGGAAQMSTKPFADALNEVKQAAVHAAIMPTPQVQQALSSMIGGAQVQPAGKEVDFDKAVKWVAVGIDYPGQDQAVKVVLQAQDEESAQKLQQGLSDQIARARQSEPVQENAPQLASDKQLLQPERDGDQVSLSVSNEEASKMIARALQAQAQHGQGNMQRQGASQGPAATPQGQGASPQPAPGTR